MRSRSPPRTKSAVLNIMVSRPIWKRRAGTATVTLTTEDVKVTVRVRVAMAMVIIHLRVGEKLVGFFRSWEPS